MKHISKVPVPRLIQENCKQDPRGLYVPVVVLKEGDIYHFKINDQKIVNSCVANKCCSVCGTALKDDVWFIGGPASVFHKRGAIADLPVHKECGEYALQACPYMAYSRYTSKTDLLKLYEKLQNKDILLENTTLDNNRVPMFCFVKASDYTMHITHTLVFKPVMPYLETQFWNDGVQLSKEEGEQILKEHFEERYTIEDLDYQIS